MNHQRLHADGASARDENYDAIPPFMPSIGTDDIFRMLIADELRNGRLTAAHRRRIIGYAAQLGLTAVQTGRLIAECRDEALQSEDPVERRHALRLVEPPPVIVPTHAKIALVVGAALVLDFVLFHWLW